MTARKNSARSGNATLAGVGLMLLGVFLFSCNDAQGKWLLATYPVGQMLLIRSIAALAVISPFIWREGLAPFKAAPRPGVQILRVILATAEVAMFFWAVSYLPLADTVTFYLAGPIYVTALSALFLGEAVGWRRWTAVVVGFIGVVIALRPSTAMLGWPSLIALAGSLCYAVLMIVTRTVRGTSDIVMASGQIVATLIFGLVTAPFGWVTPTGIDYVQLALLGVVATLALMCVNRSLKLAPASVVAPYQYTLIVWAIAFGYVVFGDIPDAAMLTGAAIIIAAGFYIFLRERTMARREEPFTPLP